LIPLHRCPGDHGQRLPVQVISGNFSSLAHLRAGTVLVDDHAEQEGSAGDAEIVSDSHLQFVRGGRGWIFNRQGSPGPPDASLSVMEVPWR